ncbi:MAG: hypothetical protein AAGD32_18180 [Planctomycetota bacterium]
MSDADQFNETLRRRERVTEEKHPPGFEPGLEYGGDTATGSVAADDADLGPGELPDEEWLIHRFGLNPDTWSIIDGTLNVRQWQRYDGQWQHYFRAQLRRRQPAELAISKLILDRTAKRPPVKKSRRIKADGSYSVLITDQQIGKSQGGGVDGFIARFADSIDAAVHRYQELLERGWKLPHIGLYFGGDIIEGIGGNYASQPFQIELGMRDQIEIASATSDYAIDRFAEFGVPVDAVFVPSNHGEQRSGKSIATEERDSTDLIVADQLRRAYDKNPRRYGHVNVVVPWGNHTTVCIDTPGGPVGLAHSHQTGRKKTSQWWKDQIAGGVERPLHRARVLFVGHLHHLHIEEVADGRFLVQGPALDGGSMYFTEFAGESSPPGVVTCVVADGVPRELELVRSR